MGPQLRAVEEAGRQGLMLKRAPHQITTDDFFEATERLRATFARLVGANDPRRIVIVPSVSYGIANAAQNIPLSKGEEILLAGEQFPSNVYAWQRLAEERGGQVRFVDPPEMTSDRGAIWNERLLEAISPATKVVALGHVHWADGTRFDLKRLRERATEVGAYLVVDGTQSVGALPFDVQELQPDALICAGYKWLLGPYAFGLSYYGAAFDEGRPIEENWINRYNSEDFAGLVRYESRYQPAALRYEVGEHSNFIMVPMMQAALDQIEAWGIGNIQSYCHDLTADTLRALQELGGYVETSEYRAAHLFGIRLSPQVNAEKLQEELKAQQVSVSFRGTAMRVSPHLYNRPEDMDLLMACFKAAQR
jgi:selenocysteine lyase/cysteine desulfurase